MCEGAHDEYLAEQARLSQGVCLYCGRDRRMNVTEQIKTGETRQGCCIRGLEETLAGEFLHQNPVIPSV